MAEAPDPHVEGARAAGPDAAFAPGTVLGLLEADGAAAAARPWALVHRDGAWGERSLGDLLAEADEIAAGLVALGVQAGEAVGLLAETRAEWTATDIGILRAGAVVVPLYATSSPDECRHVLRDAGAVALVAEDAGQAAKVEDAGDDARALREVVTMEAAAGHRSLADLRRLGRERLAAEPGVVAARAGAVRPDDVCTIVYTSGTTGPPKGCVLLHRNYRAMADMGRRAAVVRPGDVVYLYLPLAHVFARLAQFMALAEGATLAYTRGIPRIQEDVAEVRPTVLPSVPRLFEKVRSAVLARGEALRGPRRRLFAWAVATGLGAVAAAERGAPPRGAAALRLRVADRLVLGRVRERLGGRLRVCVSGGAPIDPEVVRFFAACGIPVLEGYGLTESTTAVSINLPGATRPGTVGRPLPGVEVRLAPDGEILVRGPNVFAGYHGHPEETARTVVDGWLATGDVGEIEDGFLRITDRKKDIIVTAGGKNVAPATIERALRTSPHIAEACLVGDRRPYLVALVVLDDDELDRYAAARGDVPADPVARRRHPDVVRAVDDHVAAVNATLGRSAQIRRWAILDAPFTPETGELTPTLKVRRAVVARRHADVIERLYA